MALLLNEIVDENYKHAIRRGKITGKTKESDFLFHLQQEFAELIVSNKLGDNASFRERVKLINTSTNNKTAIRADIIYCKKYKQIMAGTKSDEIADMILVLFSYSKFMGIDVEKAITSKLLYNSLRDMKNEETKATSCLEYLLDILDKGEVFKIYYNSDHCIGISGSGIYEKDSNAFKKSIENGEKVRYFELSENYPYESIVNSFGLSDFYKEILKKYYDARIAEEK